MTLERNQEIIKLPDGSRVYVWRQKWQRAYSARITDERGVTVCEWLARFDSAEEALEWGRGQVNA